MPPHWHAGEVRMTVGPPAASGASRGAGPDHAAPDPDGHEGAPRPAGVEDDGRRSSSRPGRPRARQAELVVREATDAETAGRPLVIRASAAAVAGGLVVAVVAAAFGPRLMIADVRAVGIGVGVLAVALGLGPLVTGRALGTSTGPLLLACGLVSLPVAAGGLVVGSVLLVGAGIVLASVRSAPDGAHHRLETGHLPRRVAATLVDLALTAVLVVLASATVLNAALTERPVLAFAVWTVSWTLVTVPTALRWRAAPGQWLLNVSVLAPSTEPAPWSRAVPRQLLRGILTVGPVLATGSLALTVGLLGAAAFLLALLLAVVVATVVRPAAPSSGWTDHLTRTVTVTAVVRAG
ncbi:MAG: RDD family protein [Dermatophilaceae bacterium]